MRKTRVMHTWRFDASGQYVWTPGNDEKGFASLVKKEHPGYEATEIKVGFMRVENVFCKRLGRGVPSTVIADDGEGEQVVYGIYDLDQKLLRDAQARRAQRWAAEDSAGSPLAYAT